MKRELEAILNIVYKKDIESLFGTDSYIEVTDMKYSTNTKKYMLECKLYVSDIELFKESNVDGVKYLINESWKWTGSESVELALLTSVDLL